MTPEELEAMLRRSLDVAWEKDYADITFCGKRIGRLSINPPQETYPKFNDYELIVAAVRTSLRETLFDYWDWYTSVKDFNTTFNAKLKPVRALEKYKLEMPVNEFDGFVDKVDQYNMHL